MQPSGNITSGTYLFTRSNSFKAAKLAYKTELAKQTATGSKSSAIIALKQAINAFKYRRVSIPDLLRVGTIEQHTEIKNLVTVYTGKHICRRKLSPFELPEDWKWSHGSAKNLTRQVVLRHWSSPHLKDSSIHTALSMKDQKSNDYSAWAPDCTPKDDAWVVSTNKRKRKIGQLLAPIRNYIGKYLPGIAESYSEEKSMYISPKARVNLGRIDREMAKAEQFAKLLEDAKKPLASAGRKIWAEFRKMSFRSRFSPRGLTKIAIGGVSEFRKLREARHEIPPEMPSDDPKGLIKAFNFQKKNRKKQASNDALATGVPLNGTRRRKNPWERRAQKVYLPCSGYNQTKEGKDRFVMFGLDLEAMRHSWDEVKKPDNPRHFYRMLSKYQNCSGMSLSLLEKGGARTYATLTPKLYTTQTMVDKYSHKLMGRLDTLNEKSEFLRAKFKSLDAERTLLSETQAVGALRLSSKTGSRKFRNSLYTLASMSEKFIKTDRTIEALTPFAIKFIETLEHAYSVSGGGEKELAALEPALCVFANLRSRMMMATEKT